MGWLRIRTDLLLILICTGLVVRLAVIPTTGRRLASLRGGDSELAIDTETLRSQTGESETFEVQEASLTVPLHATSGTHHVYVYVGSPPQRQALIVDTGSRLMAFPCRPCRQCGKHTSSFFDPAVSTTDVIPECGKCFLEDIATCSPRDNKCHLSQKYTEGSSWRAYETEDIVWFGSPEEEESYESFMRMAIPYAFGCQTQETGLFTKQYADGILGLAMHDTSVIQAMYQLGSIPRNAFSMCLTAAGGHFSLGGALTSRHLEPMKFSPLVKTAKSWYSVAVLEVRVGHVCVACREASLQSWWLASELTAFASGKGTILDSGTTDTYLPQAVEGSFKKAWKQVTGMDYEKRTRLYTFDEFLTLPRINFVLASGGFATGGGLGHEINNDKSKGVPFTLFPESFMEGVPLDETGKVKPWSGTEELINRVYVDEAEGAVIGANGMINKDIYFDVEGKRVGIATADCGNSVTSSSR